MKNKTESKFSLLFFWIIILLLYVLIFEFIFPSNKILPRPGLLFESIQPLEKDYHLSFNFLYSFSGIYLTLIISYFVFEVLAVYLISLFTNFSQLINLITSLRFFPILGAVTIFVFWFPYSFISEYIFYFAFSFVFLISSLHKEKTGTKREYIDSIISITGSKKRLIYEITVKQCQPEIFYSLRKIHFYLWTIMLVFEYVKAQSGLGSIFRNALLYNDISILFLLTLVILIITCSGDYVIRLIYNKTYQWER